MPSVPTRSLSLGWDRVPKGLGAGRVVLLRREGAGPPHSPPVIHTWPFTASWSQHELRPAGRCTCRLPPPAVMAPRDGFPLTPAGAVTAGTAVVDHAVEFSKNERFLQTLGLSGHLAHNVHPCV